MNSHDYEPKKYPRQVRSKATFQALLDATARVLSQGGYAALTTNGVADVAGVGIASLYEYFPGKDALVAVLAERQLARLVNRVAEHLPAAVEQGGRDGIHHLFQVTVGEVAEQAALYRVLLREIPFVPMLPAVQELQGRAFSYARAATGAMRGSLGLPRFEQDVWLLWQMIYNTALEIGFADVTESERDELVWEFVRLVSRMLFDAQTGRRHGT